LSRLAALILAGAFAAAGAACGSSGQADINTLAAGSDRLIWEAASKDLAKKRYETARQYLNRLIEAFPNSQYQPQARLALADSYFQEKNVASYILAAAEYREFGNLYPSHEKADYAQFQVGESYFRQRRPPDRDQSNTKSALAEFERFVELFPDSSRIEEAKKRRDECRQTLARSEFLVGDFYQRTRRACHAAIQRYQGILDLYADYQRTDEVLLHLSECLIDTGRAAEALPQIDRLLSGYPDSPYRDEAQILRQRATETVQAPPPEGVVAPIEGAAPPASAPGAISSGTLPSAKNP
jgi:outer membrane protein assembly factor BamD